MVVEPLPVVMPMLLSTVLSPVVTSRLPLVPLASVLPSRLLTVKSALPLRSSVVSSTIPSAFTVILSSIPLAVMVVEPLPVVMPMLLSTELSPVVTSRLPLVALASVLPSRLLTVKSALPLRSRVLLLTIPSAFTVIESSIPLPLIEVLSLPVVTLATLSATSS